MLRACERNTFKFERETPFFLAFFFLMDTNIFFLRLAPPHPCQEQPKTGTMAFPSSSSSALVRVVSSRIVAPASTNTAGAAFGRGISASLNYCGIIANNNQNGSLNLGTPSLFSSPCTSQVRFKRGKRKKKTRAADRPPELKDTKGPRAVSLQDRIDNGPEAPYQVARNINKYLTNVSKDEKSGSFHWRRKKDFPFRQRHRMMRFAGLTHDFQEVPEENGSKIKVETPLHQLQKNATLPKTLNESRFPFPHLLSYKVYWGSDVSPMENPNSFDPDSMKSVKVTFDCKDLTANGLLNDRADEDRLLAIVGDKHFVPGDDEPKNGNNNDENNTILSSKYVPNFGRRRYQKLQALEKQRKTQVSDSRVVTLQADLFPERNHNAAFLADLTEGLIKEARVDAFSAGEQTVGIENFELDEIEEELEFRRGRKIRAVQKTKEKMREG